MVEEDDYNIPVTLERWNAVKNAAVTEMQQFISKVIADIISLATDATDIIDAITAVQFNDSLKSRFKTHDVNDFQFTTIDADNVAATKEHFSELVNSVILERASTIVRCGKCSSIVFGAEALAHASKCRDSYSSYYNSHYHWWKKVQGSARTAVLLFRRINLPDNALVEDVKNLKTISKCKCGYNDDSIKSINFANLVGVS